MTATPQSVNRFFKMAVLTGVASSVRLHIDRGDDLNARDDKGLTLLMIAASRNKAEICRLLLAANADATLLDPAGRDARTIAKMAGAIEACTVLEPERQNANPLPRETEETEATNSHWSETESRENIFEGLPAFMSGEDSNDFDLSSWIAEEDAAPPCGNPLLVVPAVTIHHSISEHSPIDDSIDWDQLDVDLPCFAAPVERIEDAEKRDRLRLLLTRAMREGSVPLQAVEDMCLDDDQAHNLDAERLLIQTINDLGAECDERFEYESDSDSFRVFVAPSVSADETENVDEALRYFDGFTADSSSTSQFRDLHREFLLTASEEIALAQTMEASFEAALDALAAWPSGIAALLADCKLVASNIKSIEWIVSTTNDPEIGEERVELEDATDADTDAETGEVPEQSLLASSEEEEPIQDSTSLHAKAKELSLMLQSNAVKDEHWNAIRAALTAMAIQRSYLLSFVDDHHLDNHLSAKLFVKALIRQRQARDRMTLANLRLVRAHAKRFLNSGMELDDLIQEGNIGLLKGVDRFDWRKGFRFSTYATWWIRQRISRAVADKSRMIRLPVHVYQTALRVDQAALQWQKEHGEQPSSDQLSTSLGIRRWKIDAMRRGKEPFLSLETCGIDEMIPPNVSQRFIHPDPSAIAVSRELQKRLGDVLSTLSPREEKITRLRFGIGVDREHTLEELGSLFDLTRERIRQIEAKALRALRHPSRWAALIDWTDLKSGTAPPKPVSAKTDKDKADIDAAATSDFEMESAASALDDDVAEHDGEMEAEIEKDEQQSFANQTVRVDNSQPVRNLTSSLIRLLDEAKALGIKVDDQRQHDSGYLWVRIHGANDTTTRSLIRRLMGHGFSYSPGSGYFR
jgi:RNA polymerase primary sigma factor